MEEYTEVEYCACINYENGIEWESFYEPRLETVTKWFESVKDSNDWPIKEKYIKKRTMIEKYEKIYQE